MPAYSELLIDPNALYQNFKLFDRVPAMPMLKANGYGVGAVQLAHFFSRLNVPYLGVSYLQEAIALRQAGLDLPILVLSFLPHEAKQVIDYQLTASVDTIEKIRALDHAATSSYPVHIKINSGLNRFGATVEEAPALIHALKKSRHLFIEGIMTHLMGAKDPSKDTLTHQQLSSFEKFVAQLPERPKWIHANASTSYHKFPSLACNMARIGFGLFVPHLALTLRTRVLATRYVEKGEAVSYCGNPLNEHKKIAVLGIGYHDGWHCSYGPSLHVMLNQQPAPVLGQICMDFMMVDITHHSKVCVGDWAEIFGPQQPLEQLGCALNTNPRLILASLGERIDRIWLPQTATSLNPEYLCQPTLIKL
ncbi:MAG: alanine racemase [Verrucomicrobia bacterium]|nr:alanine racemase [Verrucomicrobiota bacterium]MBS0647480.1 alanine racemase [Verrucomicrobiota bacterium]